MASPDRPNFLFVMSNDHAAHAISAYGSRINETPHLDPVAANGMRFDHCFCTNSICTPSRAAILTGTYNHVNGLTTLDSAMDNRLQTFPSCCRAPGTRPRLSARPAPTVGVGQIVGTSTCRPNTSASDDMISPSVA